MSECKKSVSEIKRNFWRQHINNWEASNISQKQYCKQENISFTSFAWWKTRGFKKQALKAVSFVPGIVNAPQPTGIEGLQFIFPNHLKLILPSSLLMKDLAILIQALGALS